MVNPTTAPPRRDTFESHRRPRWWLACVALLVVALAASCEEDKPQETAPPPIPKSAAEPAADKPAADTPAPEENPTAGAEEAETADTDAGAEVLPDPDFSLKGPELRAPSLGGKKGSILGGGDDSAGSEDKPRLLDTELKKDE